MSTTPTAQTSAEHLPLVFHGPPGWPAPTLEWVNTHLGWQPPPGWVPVPGCPHSPPRWIFWSRNDVAWRRMARPYLRRARFNEQAGVVLCALFGWFTAVGIVGGSNPLWPVLLHLAGLITVGIKTWQARARVRQIETDLLTGVRDAAEQLKAESDRAHYARYLRSAGGNG